MKINYFIAILLFFSCKKDPDLKLQPVSSYTCQQGFDVHSKLYDTIYTGSIDQSSHCLEQAVFFPEKYRYTSPCPNPKNPFEFCYLRSNANGWDLWKYNFCNGVANKIAPNINYFPQWSSTNWIIYTGLDLQLWKIKSNGDSLTRLTNTGNYNNYAVWSPNGKKIIYYDANVNVGVVIADEFGTQEKLLPNFMTHYCWKTDSEIIYSTGQITQFVHELNLNTNYDRIIGSVKIPGQPTFSYDLANNSLLICDSAGLSKINLKTLNKNLIIRFYGNTAIGLYPYRINNKILMSRILCDTAYPCVLRVKNNLTLLDTDGTTEKRIMFPE